MLLTSLTYLLKATFPMILIFASTITGLSSTLQILRATDLNILPTLIHALESNLSIFIVEGLGVNMFIFLLSAQGGALAISMLFLIYKSSKNSTKP